MTHCLTFEIMFNNILKCLDKMNVEMQDEGNYEMLLKNFLILYLDFTCLKKYLFNFVECMKIKPHGARSLQFYIKDALNDRFVKIK